MKMLTDMKHNLLKYTLVFVTALLLTSCATWQRGRHIYTSPYPYSVEADSSRLVTLDVNLVIPDGYFSRRSRIIITPEVIADDSATLGQLKPVVLDGSIFHKKTLRRQALEKHYVDPYAAQAQRISLSKPAFIPYQAVFQMPEEYDHGVVAAAVSHDGCASCTGIDRLVIADITVPEPEIEPEPVIERPVHESLGLTWMEPEFVVREKLMQGQGTAHLQFIINKYDIVPELSNNRRELEDMVSKLEPILNDTLATITSITIYGMASADGSLAFNTPLSANRAQSAKNWLAERLQLPADLVSRIQTGSRPEGWQPVLDAMTRAGNPDSVKVKDILTRYADKNDDVQEYHIRRLACWPTIRDNYLQKDRKVDYTYAWKIRSFTTDAELVTEYRNRPDAFNEEELLRVAQLATTDGSQMAVYRYVLSRFPASEVAANNLAILLERYGQYDEARQVIEAQKQFKSYQKK